MVNVWWNWLVAMVLVKELEVGVMLVYAGGDDVDLGWLLLRRRLPVVGVLVVEG
jgi:hypothetical protein